MYKNFLKLMKIIEIKRLFLLVIFSYFFMALLNSIAIYSLGLFIDLITKNQIEKRFIFFVLIIILFIFNKILEDFLKFLISKISLNVAAKIRKKYIKSILDLNYTNFKKSNLSDFAYYGINEFNYFFETIIEDLSMISISLFSLVFAIFFMGYYSIVLLLTFLVLFIVLSCIIFWINSKNKKEYILLQKNKIILNDFLENLYNIKENIVLNQKEKLFLNKFKELNKKVFKKTSKIIFFKEVIWPISHISSIVVQIVILLMSLLIIEYKYHSYFNNPLTIGSIIAFQFYIRQIFNKSIRFFKSILNLNTGIISFLRFKEFDLKNSKYIEWTSEKNFFPINEKVESLTLKKINFDFSNKTILKNVNFVFKNKKNYFILGKSGSGKSTLLNLIAGYYKADNGEIIFNNNYEINYLHLKNNVIMVNQRDYFFNETIEDNFNFIKENGYSEMLQILKENKMDILAKNLSNNIINTNLINELSQGERRILSLIRALLLDRDIILLDEITSSLSEEDSKKIYSLIKKECQNKIVISVTHNLEIIEKEDITINLN